MTFLDTIEDIRKEITKITKELGYEGIGRVEVSEPTVKEYGDLSTAISFEIAKKYGKNPNEVALELTSRMKFDFCTLEIKNGYINFRFNSKYFSDVINEILEKGEKYGVPKIDKPLRILIEHTNANPNKPLHLGTVRNTILGDTLARILSYVGHKVIVLNYIDDSGAQVADNILAMLELGYPQDIINEKYDHYAGRVYAEVHEKIEASPELRKRKYEILKKIEEGQNEVATLSRKFAEKVVVEQLKTCWKLGAFFDLLNWESDIVKSGLLNVVLSELEKRGRIYVPLDGKNRGCKVLKLSDVSEFKGLEEPDEILVRSDGTSTYVGKDIAYAFWKINSPPVDFKYRQFLVQPNGKILWTTDSEKGDANVLAVNNADLAITLVDIRQEYPQKVVKTALSFIDSKALQAYRPFLYGVVAVSGKTAYKISNNEDYLKRSIVHMSGRKGLVINADELLDILSKIAKEESRKRNPEAEESWLDSVSSEIAVAAIRYSMLKMDLNSTMVFDLEEATRLDGDSGPRLQYTYARAYGIIEKAGNYEKSTFDVDLLKDVSEVDLIKEMSKFSFIVKTSVEMLEPKFLARYAKSLSDKFNSFYERCPVLSAPKEQKDNRIILVSAFLTVYGKVLELLGIPALRRM